MSKCYKCSKETTLNYRNECDDCEQKRKRDEDDDNRRRQDDANNAILTALLISMS